MKRVFYLLIITCAGYLPAVAQSSEQLWEAANTAYINDDYQEAVKGYESIRAQGKESNDLYLNLGNAYFKRGMTGMAILNYHRALRLSPSDEDVLYNLGIANARVQDKIDVVPTFFVKRWMSELRSSLTSNAWAGLSLLCFMSMLGALIVYLLAGRLRWRKIGFYGVLGGLTLFVVTALFAGAQRKAVMHPGEAIIMSNAAPVKSSPDQSSKDIFILHEGTQVRVKDALGEFREIVISDGNKGWVAASAIEMID